MDGRAFLKLAQRLASGNSEAEWRSAVSRGYYAAFHVASSFISSLGFRVPKGPQAHDYLVRRFANCDIHEVMTLASKLKSLRVNRNSADYRLYEESVRKTCYKDVRQAGGVISQLDTFSKDDSTLKQQILDKIKRYEEQINEITH